MGGNERTYSANSDDYKLLEEVGYGASATVYRAIYIPFNEVIAVKCLDLDRCNSNLDDIRREAQTMALIDHSNIIKAYCSFVVDHNLWVIMPFMAEGSCLHLMKIAYPDGFDEPAICSILKETLKAIEYLHQQGHIHRDVKAGNILLDTSGVVKLADFGVSACMFDTGDRQRSRNTFVGTPCWMAPEVLQPGSGYNFKADIWSFGITALELAHGHAPFSKYPPMKVLLMTIQNAPPGLDYDRDKKFSKLVGLSKAIDYDGTILLCERADWNSEKLVVASFHQLFKEMIAMCLVKDQTKRPTAEKLLKHAFFKNAKSPEVTVKPLFTDLPPLWQRVKAIQLKDAAQLALKKMPSAEQEALSMSEYQRGVSAWNFDVEDLKAQAAMLRDDDDNYDIPEAKEDFGTFKPSVSEKFIKSDAGDNEYGSDEIQPSELPLNKAKIPEEDLVDGGSSENFSCKKNGIDNDVMTSSQEKDSQSKFKVQPIKNRQTQSGPLITNAVLGHSTSEKRCTSDWGEFENAFLYEKTKCEMQRAPSFSGPLMLPNRASANSLSAPIKSCGGFRDSLDDKAKASLVQIKGRFSVTSENLDLVKDIPLNLFPRRQGSPLTKSASVGECMFDSKPMTVNSFKKDCNNSIMPGLLVLPHLQNLYQQTTIQQELILSLVNSLQPSDADGNQNGKLLPLPCTSESNGNVEPAAAQREQLLLIKVAELQGRMMNLTYELTKERVKYMQLQQQLNALSSGHKDPISEQ